MLVLIIRKQKKKGCAKHRKVKIMSLVRIDGVLYDQKSDGRLYTPRLGEEVVEDMIVMFPVALKLSVYVLKGIHGVVKALRNLILTKEEVEKVENWESEKILPFVAKATGSGSLISAILAAYYYMWSGDVYLFLIAKSIVMRGYRAVKKMFTKPAA